MRCKTKDPREGGNPPEAFLLFVGLPDSESNQTPEESERDSFRCYHIFRSFVGRWIPLGIKPLPVRGFFFFCQWTRIWLHYKYSDNYLKYKINQDILRIFWYVFSFSHLCSRLPYIRFYLIFCRKVYFPKKIDNCPVYGGFRPGNLAGKYGRNVVWGKHHLSTEK